MTPTLFVALLSHPDRYGATIGDEARKGAPLHLTFHTTAEDAAAALETAMVAEWNLTQAAGLGGASRWDRALRSRRMVEAGYLAAVVERPVLLAGEVVPS